jgi:mono/diheme cytochrome c family protein
MNSMQRPFSGLSFLAAVLLALSATAAISQEQEAPEPITFEARCGQCHKLDQAERLVPAEWVARVSKMGSVVDLKPEEQAEVLSFFQHHGQEASRLIAMARERRVFLEKCGMCHNPNRSFLQPFEGPGLRETVERMQARAPDEISDDDVETVISYIESGAEGNIMLERVEATGSPASVFRVRCSSCHTLERTFLKLEREGDRVQWGPNVRRMQARAPQWISDQEAEIIITYLEGLKPLMEFAPEAVE